MKLLTTITLLSGLMLGGIPSANSQDEGVVEVFVGRSWKADKADNICGISDLKKVTKPAVVDYDELLKATPQIQKMVKKGIDPESTEGKALRQAASSLITKSAQTARKAGGYCGVWKAIEHKDGRDVPDITDEIIEEF